MNFFLSFFLLVSTSFAAAKTPVIKSEILQSEGNKRTCISFDPSGKLKAEKPIGKKIPKEDPVWAYAYVGSYEDLWMYMDGGTNYPENHTNICISGSPDWVITGMGCDKDAFHCFINFRFKPSQLGPINAVYSYDIIYEGEIISSETWGAYGQGLKFEEEPECSATEFGSILKIDNESMSERVPVTGTDLDLYYSSQFTADYFTPNSNAVRVNHFNPEGWTVSKLHYYDLASESLFLGTGSKVKRKPFSSTGGTVLIVNEDEVLVFDSNGKHLETRSSLIGYTKYSFTYTNDSKISKITNAYGQETSFTRDLSGQLSSIISPYGDITTVTVNSSGLITEIANPNQEKFTATFHTDSELIKDFTKPGGQISSFSFNYEGFLKGDESSGGNAWFLSTQKFTSKKVTQKTSKMGRVTTYSSERDDGVYLRQEVKPSGYVIEYDEHPDRAQAVYTVHGDTITETVPDERFGESLPRLLNKSEIRGDLTRVTTISKTAVLADPLDPYSYTQLKTTTDVNGVKTLNTFVKSTKASWTTDPMGVKSLVKLDDFERPIRVQHAEDIPLYITYDSHGRIERTSQNGQNTLKYTYDSKGQVATIRDALNQVTRYLYDGVGRTTRITYPDGRFIRYVYNADGKITKIFPPGKPAHLFTYNEMDLQSSYKPPLIPETTTPQTRYSYNLDKQLTLIRRPDDKSVSYRYDEEMGLLIKIIMGEGETQNYVYYPETENPRVITSPDEVKSVFTYFGPDEIGSEQQTIGTDVTKVNFLHDNFFRPVRRLLKLNGTEIGRVNTVYRPDSQPSRIGSMILTYEDISGRLSRTRLDKVRDLRTYDIYGNLKTYRAVFRQEEGSGCGTNCIQELYYFNLTRDVLHRIITKVERVQGITTSYEYTYDAVGRISSVTKNGVVESSFSYDSNSNRISGTQNGIAFTATYDAQDRLLTYALGADPVLSFSYNLNGELTEISRNGQVTTFSSDALGRLKSVTLEDASVIAYKLDWNGRRILKSLNGIPAKTSIYESDLGLAAEVDQNAVKEYVFGTNVNSADYMKVGTSFYRIIKDHLGSPRLVVDASTGTVAQRMDYNEWGKVIADTNPGFQAFGFAGGIYDKDTKLVKFGARDYDGSTGRWLSKDPIGFEGGDTNLYGYVLQDPMNLIDPSGKATLLEGQIEGEIAAYEKQLATLEGEPNCNKDQVGKLKNQINILKGDLALLKEGIKIRCGRSGAAAQRCADGFANGFPRSEE